MTASSSRRRLLALLIALPLLGAWALATSYRDLSLEEMFDSAEIAFFGTVSALAVEEREGEPWTVVEFEIDRLLAGSRDDEGSLRLAFLGGDLPGGIGLRVNLMPTFRVGERVLLLAYDAQFISPLVGFNQGLWRLTEGDLVDEAGVRLGLDDEDRLIEGGTVGDSELVLDAVERALEARQ